ncbi:MAG: efflux RND transporter periplasmic adaptor subunit [Ignavibacteria bacterium]|nr:efflux RND transporter periplasmic adaptor subunit [Ignavibacteria bacterium]
MKKILYIMVLIVIIALVIFKLSSNKNTVEEKVYRYGKQEEILITADTAAYRQLTGEITYTGTFEPYREGKVMAEAPGKIVYLNVELGDYLNAGTVVAQIDNELLKLQLDAVNVQIEGFEKDVNRYTILVEADAVQGIQLEKTILALKGAEVQRQILQEQIYKTTIRAPFSGVVTQKFTELGTVLAPSVPIIQITDISTLNLTISVPESDIVYFYVKQQLDVSSDISPDKTLPGKVIMIGSRGDAAHNFPVQIQVTNTRNLLLKASMFGSVKILVGDNQSNITVPKNAIFGSSIKPQIYVIENGKTILKDVAVGFQNENYTTISHGIKDGEIIVTSGFINLQNGSPVKTQ